MHTFRVSTVLVCGFLALSLSTCSKKPTDVPMTGQITGRVTDSQSGLPIELATITTSPVTASASTNTNGEFLVSNVSPGSYSVTASKTGYANNTVSVTSIAGQDVAANITLAKILPVMGVAPTVMNFGTTSTTLQLNISNSTGAGTLSWTITKPADAIWLNLSVSGGQTLTTPSSVILTIDRTGLSPNNYNTVLTITSNGGNTDVQVLMTVPNPSAPQLSLSTTSLDFDSLKGTQFLNIFNTGTGNLNYQISSNSNWLTVSPGSGSLASGQATISIMVDRSGLAAGSTNIGILSITSNGGSSSINASVNVAHAGTLSAPVLRVVSYDETGCNLAWTECLDNVHFGSYKVFSSTTAGVGNIQTHLTTILNSTQNSYQVSGVVGPLTIYYKVFVYDKNGVTTGSNEVSVVYPAPLKTWTMIKSFDNDTLTSVFALNDNLAWVSTNHRIYKYDGLNWNVVYTWNAVYTNWAHINSICFLSATEGYAAYTKDYDGGLLKYDGISWQTIDSYSGDGDFVKAATNMDIYYGGPNGLHKWNGSGRVECGVSSPGQPAILSPNKIFVISTNDMYHSALLEYNGLGWSQRMLPLTQISSLSVGQDTSIWFLNWSSTGPDTICFIRNDSLVKSVQPRNSSGSLKFSRPILYVLSKNDVWAAENDIYGNGSNELLHYNGSSWKTISVPLDNNVVLAFYFINSTSGWAITKNKIYVYR